MSMEHGHAAAAAAAPASPAHLKETQSDGASWPATVPHTVMAEQVTNDVVKEAQSVGRPAPIDASASATSTPAPQGEQPAPAATTTTSTIIPASSDPPHPSPSPDLSNGHVLPSVNGAASAGSDTDISRPSSVDQSKQGAAGAPKKSSTFKSVSVTKNFLAKSAATPSAQPGAKLAPAVQAPTAVLTAKPRLVAKSGGSNTPRALGSTNGASPGPDASKVWNKNQPVPPPPPKQFTDEELKQQYGIHLATRLQTDEGSKEAKWADIDDDEDDWAPDTVQWMDGTKSSVAAENQPPPAEPPKPITIAKPETPANVPKPAPAAPIDAPKTSVTGGAKTILKPGAHAQPGGKTSLVLKGQPEKPTLVAKPTTGVPAKSPWAPLPPVERVSPVQINPPTQPPPHQRYSQQDTRAYDSMAPPPAKEIAPDDFNRAWREERGGRELFNSQSGRYEPVNDVRRGSFRDSGYRQQPAVLQRPSQDGHAEPSSAFQTSRSGDAPAWGRRRNSSNVSGGPGRRMSMDRRGPDFAAGPVSENRREAPLVNGSDSGHEVPRQASFASAVSPQISQAHPASPSVASAGHQEAPAPAPAPAAPMEDPVEVQKRMMADKIERARLKKQQQLEAEKKEEEEKKERIAKRLAAMGSAGMPKPKTVEQATSPAGDQSPQKTDAVAASVQSPPKPPVPTVEGEVAQYGMMKVHQPHPVKKPSPVPRPARPAEPSTSGRADGQSKPALSPDQQAAQATDALPPHDAQKKPFEQSKSLAQQAEGANAPGSTKPTQAVWTSPSAAQPRSWTSQVWGPMQNKERALGNGTFDASYNRGQPRSASQQQLPAQSPSSTTAPIGTAPATQPAMPQAATLPLAQPPVHAQPRPLPAQAVAPAKPNPIAPPLDKGWGNFAAHIRRDDANMIVKARQDFERLGGEKFRPEIRETYKDQRGNAQTVVHTKVAGNVPASDNTPVPRGSPSGPELKSRDDVAKPTSEGTTPLQQGAGSRSSRFFPRPIETATPATTYTSSKADSPPPPPETESHPAFTGDISHPLVRLPKPSPVVRLPKPMQGAAETASVSMPARGHQALGARPLAMDPEWQARFNKLLDKPAPAATTATAPAQSANFKLTPAVPTVPLPRPSSLAVAASSKASLDVRGTPGSATVSFPATAVKKDVTSDTTSESVSRKGTEALFEDREFGSLPTVNVPKVPHLTANEPAATMPKDEPHGRFKRENPFTIRRLEAFDADRLSDKIDVVIRLSNMNQAITRYMPKRRRHNKPNKRNITPNGFAAGNTKERPRKVSQQNSGDRTSSSPHAAHTSASWTTAAARSVPPHLRGDSWAKRAAASVH
jgi:hypothetical protein